MSAGSGAWLARGGNAARIRCTTPRRGSTVANASAGPAEWSLGDAAGSISRWITPAGASAETR